ncbi:MULTISPECIES: M23 family metallopeptidase [Mesonia]|uniref:Murein DD-endopeptidase MepM n=1 Tax=Mesonia oceanica TaxID=2687242 RepID=A0AC61YD27_9FLAO|nr:MULTISPECIES: M23 family metallopeptidase [Mesonia]MAN26422.1 peptidase M23 [Mesonia sp.]MAQ39562.1 peptidase M23 [Mesonia sp.]MBJ99151.1 peptidase M23 [Flavobacteriaceae bacterium]VVV02417.1 Murein DD-endopeptidase MepM [Mesonia oceanica]|tara:strand:+ start:4738 stop:5712 length:975 start_codon:yes stop_codon:yes gene_type:complete
MSKVKYYYDSETLSYRKIERKKGRKLGYALLGITASFLAGFLLLLVYLNLPQIETPKEKAMKRELQNMKLQYEVLNKKMTQAQKVLAEVENRDNNIYRVYFEANPIPEEQRKAGFGGINRYKDLEGYDNSKLIVETSKRLDVLQKQIVVQSKSLDEIANLAEEKEKLLTAIPAIQPVKNENLNRMASGYGMRMHPILKYRKMHNGMDFSAPTGSEVYATGDAVVKKAQRTTGFGNLIVLDHGFGYETYYAHLSDFKVRKGEKVKRGEVIGEVGSTGLSTAPHLHYEVHKNGKVVNPINFYHGDLTAEEYDIMLNQSALENQSLD